MGANSYQRAISTLRLDFLELLGKGYVIDHCVSFFLDELKKERELYYIADCLRVLTENTARFASGTYITNRLYDMLNKDSKSKEPEKSGDEIAVDIISRMGLKLVGGGE